MTYTNTQVLDSIERVSVFINKNKKAPKTVKVGKTLLSWKEWKQIKQVDELRVRIQNYITKNKQYPKYVLCFKKFKLMHSEYIYIWTFDKKAKKPISNNEVYNYFCEVFGKVNTIDEALKKIESRGYSYYYDDVYTNKVAINRLKKGLGINCTDVTDILYNLGIAMGYKVQIIHCRCATGGHIRMKLNHPKHTEGSWISRDGACVISNNGKGIRCIWCPSAPVIAINPNWFMQTVNR